MSGRPARWFEALPCGRFAIYDQPYSARSASVSLVDSLAYYRSNFHLRKIWGEHPPK